MGRYKNPKLLMEKKRHAHIVKIFIHNLLFLKVDSSSKGKYTIHNILFM